MKLTEKLDDCLEKLFQYYEVDGQLSCQKNAELILQEYLDYSSENFIFEGNPLPIDKLLALKNEYIYTFGDCEFFFSLLKKYHYNMTNEIRDAIRSLGNLKDPSNNSEMIKKFLNSPIIQDISFNGKDKYIIESEQYGSFEFQQAKEHFRNNDTLIYYMEHNKILQRCHTNTRYIASIFPEFYSVTSLCGCYFEEKFYHSYSLNKETRQIIDLCINAVMEEDPYYRLYQPQELSVILNKRLEEEYCFVNCLKTTPTNPQKVAKLLKISLYKQYLNSIGYQGELRDAPAIKKAKK